MKSPHYSGHPLPDMFLPVNMLLKIGLTVPSQFPVFLASNDLLKFIPTIQSIPIAINSAEK